MTSATEFLDELKNDSQTQYLKEQCPSLFDDSGTPNMSYSKILSSEGNIIIPDNTGYYKVVETGNNYVNKLLMEEEKYLKEKYGESLYDYFTTKREDYIKSKTREVCNNIIGESVDDSDTASGDTASSDNMLKILDGQFRTYGDLLVTYNEVNKKNYKKTERDSLNARKFYYRSDAMEDTNKIDKIITVFYYVILICSIIYLILRGKINTNIKKQWWIYLILFLFPLLLPRIYNFFMYNYYSLMSVLSKQGPKKAFLNQT